MKTCGKHLISGGPVVKNSLRVQGDTGSPCPEDSMPQGNGNPCTGQESWALESMFMSKRSHNNKRLCTATRGSPTTTAKT